MTRQGLIAAINYSNQLPVFESLEVARESLTMWKDETLRLLLSEIGSTADLNYSPDSLKRLERWYFEASCPESGTGGYSTPHALGFYFGEVLCQSAGYQWIVEEDFLQAGRFEIGVRKGLCTIMLMRGRKPVLKGNARMQSLSRDFKKFSTIGTNRK
jgi:hypothetical protein